MSVISTIRTNNAYFEDFITRSVYHSNRIEGNTLSYAETYAIVFNDNAFTVSAKPREIYEAINLKYALSYMMEHCEDAFSVNFIKQLGIIINKNINEIDGFRKVPVIIQGVEHLPPAPGLVPSLIGQFVYNYVNTVYESPYERAAATHIEFERIHPFSDGNGRVGRILLNYEMLRNDLPPIVIPADQRTEYFAMLADQDAPALAKFLSDLSREEGDRLKKLEL